MPNLNFLYIALIFLSSFMIDLDHYINALYQTRSFDYRKNFRWYREVYGLRVKKDKAKGIRRRGPFHLFHTIEFHILVLLLGIFVWEGFYFIFIGMIYHSLLDIIMLVRNNSMYEREFFFFNWIYNKLYKTNK